MMESRSLYLPPSSWGGTGPRECLHLQNTKLSAVEPLQLEGSEWAEVGEAM